MALEKEWFTVDEAARYLGVSRRTIYKYAQEGRMGAYLLGNRRIRRFRKADLDQVPRALAGARSNARALSAEEDPVLADLWDNERDASYDSI